MPVPTLVTDLSTTIGSNFPAGSSAVGDIDDTLRAHAAFIASIAANSGNGWTSPYERVAVANVRAYGALGNGTADDTAAIQSAITSLGSAGGVLFFPAGNYKITNAIFVASNTVVRGAGWASRIMTGTSITSGGAGIGARLLDLTGVSNVLIENILLDGSLLVSLPTGHRVIHAMNSSRFRVQGCYFKTSGAAVAALNCADYWVADNLVSIEGNAGFPSHDGIFDQWYGSHDFVIRGNTIYGNGQGKWGILVTGTDTAGNPTTVYNFSITENRVMNVRECGVWAMGRSGVAYDFVISGNQVETVTAGYGIAVTDCERGVVTGNLTKDTFYCGVRAFAESGGQGVRKTSISSNIIVGANTAASASADPGSAISVVDASEDVVVADNIVTGAAHRYAVYVGTAASRVSVTGHGYTKGVAGRFLVGATAANTCHIPDGITYSPTYTNRGNVASSTNVVAARYWRGGDYVTVEGIVDITPTAAAPTDTQLAISLPIASNFSVGNEAVGFAISTDGAAGSCGNVDTVNDEVRIRFSATTTSLKRWQFRFTYQVK